MRPFHLRLPAALAIVLTLAGCGLSDPYTSQHRATTSTSTPAISTTTTATVPNADHFLGVVGPIVDGALDWIGEVVLPRSPRGSPLTES